MNEVGRTGNTAMSQSAYVCPLTMQRLVETENGLVREDGKIHQNLPACRPGIPVLCGNQTAEAQAPASYGGPDSVQVYDNFLDWLFATFDVAESDIRAMMARKLAVQEGSRVLVTGCGLGDDLLAIKQIVGPSGHIWAQDLSPQMVVAAHERMRTNSTRTRFSETPGNIHLSVCDAAALPFTDQFFDAAFHFGGINLFSDVDRSISEMNRVVKIGGKVVFGDEGIAPWLKNHEYGNMMISNNRAWAAEPPLSLLPATVQDVSLTWILGNCFYLIDFTVGSSLPRPNIDIKHKGANGGSIRTRYFGRLQGIDPALKDAASRAARARGVSMQEWLEAAITNALK